MTLRERVASIIMGDRDDMDDCRMVADAILSLVAEDRRALVTALRKARDRLYYIDGVTLLGDEIDAALAAGEGEK